MYGLVKEREILLKPSILKANVANGEELQIVGTCRLNIQYASDEGYRSASTPCIVTNNLATYDIILGTDFMQKTQVHPIPHEGSIKMGKFRRKKFKVKNFSSFKEFDINSIDIEETRKNIQQQISANDSLSDAQKEQLKNLMENHLNQISSNPGKVADYFVEVDTGASKPVRAKYRVYNEFKKRAITRHINDMLAGDIIEPCESEWCSPPHLAPKGQNDTRFYINYSVKQSC